MVFGVVPSKNGNRHPRKNGLSSLYDCLLCMPLCRAGYPANRKCFDNITVWLYKGLAKPNVGKMLLKRFEMVLNLQCKCQPLANVIKTFLLT